MKIFNLRESAVRPRILLIDFGKSDAQALRECGYKVYIGSSGFEDGLFNIPIEPYRIDIVIYRVAYEPKLTEIDETTELYSLTNGRYTYKVGEDETRTIKYKFPSLAPSSQCNFDRDLVALRNSVLSKGGSILIFIGNRRIREDESIMQTLLDIKNYSVYRAGGPEKGYELFFSRDTSLQEIGDYFKDLITGKTGHSVDFLRGLPLEYLRPSDKVYPNKLEFWACDENSIAYAYFVNRDTRGNVMLLPDFGTANTDIIKHVLSMLPAFSPEALFSKEYQKGAWLESKQFKFSDELDIILQKDINKSNFEKKQNELESIRTLARSNTDYFRAILTNGDDDKSDEDEQLKPPLKKVLE